MDCVELRILTPYPGTRLYERLLSEGRLFARDCGSVDILLIHSFINPGMTADELIYGSPLEQTSLFFRRNDKRFFGMSPWKRTLFGCQYTPGSIYLP